MTSPSWRFTDDPHDPCAYCVGWSARGNPINVKGRIVPRLFRGVHDECNEAVQRHLVRRDNADA